MTACLIAVFRHLFGGLLWSWWEEQRLLLDRADCRLNRRVSYFDSCDCGLRVTVVS